VTRPTFAPWWQPWAWCWARGWADGIDRFGAAKVTRPRCQFPRHHFGRHASFDGFDVRYFDTAKEGTP
jgi:hypothetical protein